MICSFPTRQLGILISALLYAASIMAQEKPTASTLLASPCFDAPDRAVSKQRETEAIAGLPQIARFWLTEDVPFIISPEERSAFLHLGTDQERDQFIEQFWSRRAPDPTSLDNSFKREHYERIVAANQKFSTQVPGWKTDRGRLYVVCGPPDSIESHRSGEKTGRSRLETWHYQHIDGVGDNIEIEFVDPTGSGDFRLKDELNIDSPFGLGRSLHREDLARSEDKPELIVVIEPSPQVHFRGLEAVVVAQLARDQVRFTHRIEFAKATHATTFATISVNPGSDHQSSPNSVAKSPAKFEIFGRVSRKSSGRVVDIFERKLPLMTPTDSGDHETDQEFHVALAPGTYGLAIVVKDLASGEIGTLRTSFDVPPYDDIHRTE